MARELSRKFNHSQCARDASQQLDPCTGLLTPPGQLGSEVGADLVGLPVVCVIQHQPKMSQALTKLRDDPRLAEFMEAEKR